jgi:hypothetical protein
LWLKKSRHAPAFLFCGQNCNPLVPYPFVEHSATEFSAISAGIHINIVIFDGVDRIPATGADLIKVGDFFWHDKFLI